MLQSSLGIRLAGETWLGDKLLWIAPPILWLLLDQSIMTGGAVNDNRKLPTVQRGQVARLLT